MHTPADHRLADVRNRPSSGALRFTVLPAQRQAKLRNARAGASLYQGMLNPQETHVMPGAKRLPRPRWPQERLLSEGGSSRHRVSFEASSVALFAAISLAMAAQQHVPARRALGVAVSASAHTSASVKANASGADVLGHPAKRQPAGAASGDERGVLQPGWPSGQA